MGWAGGVTKLPLQSVSKYRPLTGQVWRHRKRAFPVSLNEGLEKAMSSFQAIALTLAVVVANMPIYFVIDRWIQQRSDAIVSGTVGGAPLSTQHRWIILHHSWVPSVAGLVGFESIVAAGFIMIGRSVDAEEVQLFAYLNAFVLLVAATFGGIVQGVLSYQRLKSVLRQGESH